MTDDNRLDFPATKRNVQPILQVLQRVLPKKGIVIEVASGSGQHVERFAAEFPFLTWQPSDINSKYLRSIESWTEDLRNVLPPLLLDASKPQWPIGHANSIVCINMIHIAPWSAGLGLISGAGKILSTGGVLFLYGPYKVDGKHTAESNVLFDSSLNERDPSWGVRDVNDVVKAARAVGLKFQKKFEMPANNLSLVFCKKS